MNYKRVVAMVGAALFLLTFVPYNVIYENKNMGLTFYIFTIFALLMYMFLFSGPYLTVIRI